MTNPEPTENPTPDFSQNLNWPIGSTQQLQWVEDVGTYNVRLYQRFVSEQFPDMNGYVYCKSKRSTKDYKSNAGN